MKKAVNYQLISTEGCTFEQYVKARTKSLAVRGVDEIGRVAIPKQIRNRLNILPGDNLEFSIEGKSIVMSKYKDMDTLGDLANTVAEAVGAVTKLGVVICNKHRVIGTSGVRPEGMLDVKIVEDILNLDSVFDSTEANKVIWPVAGCGLRARFIQVVKLKDVAIGAICVLEPANFIPEAEEVPASVSKAILESYAKFIEQYLTEE